MKKMAYLFCAFLVFAMLPMFSTASGFNPPATLEAYMSNPDDMVKYIKNYLSTADGEEQLESVYLPWLSHQKEKGLSIKFEWIFYPTYFANDTSSEFMDALIKEMTKESCSEKDGKKTCKSVLISLNEYADCLLKNEKTSVLRKLSHEQLVQLLGTDLGVDTSDGNDVWGGWDNVSTDNGFPDNYLDLRKQYKMAYPFKEKFRLYAPFGYSAIYGETKHFGVDLNKSPDRCCGISIYSVSSGVVTFKGKDAYGANLLIVKTGDVRILYAHMATPSPYSAGETINKGDFVGYVGTTGNSTGCHLHLEMRFMDKLINPEVFIDLQNGKAY